MNFYSSLTELSGKALVLYGFQLLAVAISFESISGCQVVLILKHNRAVAHVFETSVL